MDFFFLFPAGFQMGEATTELTCHIVEMPQYATVQKPHIHRANRLTRHLFFCCYVNIHRALSLLFPT